MNIKEIRRIVSQIRERLFKKSNFYSVGALKSHFKGMGLQFKEHRLYEPGDSTRFIDWKLLAKTMNPYIKVFEEERNVEITVIIDAHPAMFMGSDGISKLQAAIEICCLIYLIAEESKDFVHTIILAQKILNIPKESGERGISRLVSSLKQEGILNHSGQVNLEYSSQNFFNKNELYLKIAKYLKKRGEVVILSDLNEIQDDKKLKRIFYGMHLHCFQILSPIEMSYKIPFYIYAKKMNSCQKGYQTNFFLKKEIKKRSFLGRKVKILNVEERYLEKFVKEMV